jgi:hypothetical protein
MNRDKIQQLAHDAGGIRAVEYADPECFMGNMSFTDQELSVFAALVLEEAAKVAENTPTALLPSGSFLSERVAQAIRALKSEVK